MIISLLVILENWLKVISKFGVFIDEGVLINDSSAYPIFTNKTNDNKNVIFTRVINIFFSFI